MVDKADNLMHSTFAAEVQLPFRYTVIHGEDPSRQISAIQSSDTLIAPQRSYF